MTLQNFISRLNGRQILVHVVASWFFIHASQILAFLYDTTLVDAVRGSSEQETVKILHDRGMTAPELFNFVLWTSVSGLVGLFSAFIISLAISIKRHWFWFNAFFAFIATYVLYRFDLLGWTYLKQIFLYLGGIFNDSNAELLINGIVLLTIGLLIFFLKGTNQFIEKDKRPSPKATTANSEFGEMSASE